MAAAPTPSPTPASTAPTSPSAKPTEGGFVQKRIASNPEGIFAKAAEAKTMLGNSISRVAENVKGVANAVTGAVSDFADKQAEKNPQGFAARFKRKPQAGVASAL